jgi:hypothetical protein
MAPCHSTLLSNNILEVLKWFLLFENTAAWEKTPLGFRMIYIRLVLDSRQNA